MESKLLVVLVADVAGYGRLMELSEKSTHGRVMSLRREVIDPALSHHEGRMIKQTGDGFIAVFGAIEKAVLCTVAMQKEIGKREAAEPAECRIRFRMGLNSGDVVEELADVYGQAVNIAARLQDLAEPGDVVISGNVRSQTGIDPTVATIDLGHVRLKNIETPVHAFRLAIAEETTRPRVARRDQRRKASLAVLPFRAAEGDLTQAYFGEGIVEDIIGAIATMEDFFVVSRNSALAYSKKRADVRQIGEDLGVRYVLSGSVRRSSRFLRIHAELATAEEGGVIWARNFDAELGDLFDIQDEITSRIVGLVAPRVRSAEIERAFLKRPENMDAYDHFLQALSLLFRLERDDFASAGTLLRRAIALDDSYATSYALTAEWHAIRVGQGWSPDPRADSREALRLIQAAVDRDPNNVRALTLLGHYKSFLLRDYTGAIQQFDRVLELCPNSAWTWGLSSPTYSYIGDGRAAIVRTEKALRLSPYDVLAFYYHTALCIAHYTSGAYEEAAYWGQIALSENARFTAAAYPTAAALGALGKTAAGREIGQIILRANPRFGASTHATNYPYRDADRRVQLERHLLAAGLPP